MHDVYFLLCLTRDVGRILGYNMVINFSLYIIGIHCVAKKSTLIKVVVYILLGDQNRNPH